MPTLESTLKIGGESESWCSGLANISRCRRVSPAKLVTKSHNTTITTMSDSENDDLPSNAAELDPYEVLDVPRTSTDAEIRSAYRKLALKCHPDKVPVAERDAAHTTFQEVAFAYAILSDEKRRKRYDATGNTQESVLDDEDFDWQAYFKEQFRAVNSEIIEEFKEEYQGLFSFP